VLADAIVSALAEGDKMVRPDGYLASEPLDRFSASGDGLMALSH